MKVIKETHDFGAVYYLNQDEKYLRIIYGGNLDLYWHFINKKSRREETSAYQDVYESMLITKENYTIYRLFEELMSETKNGEIYKPEEIILEPTWNDEFDVRDVYDVGSLPLSEEDEESLTNHYKQEKANEVNERITSSEAYEMLYQDNTITWYSDDAPLETADIVKISKVEDGFLLEFTRPNLDPEESELHFPGTLSIRFSNSGSRYGDLVTLFTRMYNKLSEYEPEYHQIHLEEIAYQKKLELQKKDN